MSDATEPHGVAEAGAPVDTPRLPRDPAAAALIPRTINLREDQYDDLVVVATRLARGMQWNRHNRFTYATLIRIAVDLLLDHCDQARGTSELEVRTNLAAALRSPRWPGHDPDAT